MAQAKRLAKQGHGVAQPGGWLGLDERTQLLRDGADALGPQRHGHSLDRAHRVDGHRHRGDLAVNGRLFDEERLAAARLFHFAVGQLGDFQLGGDRFADTDQLARLLEGVQKLCVRFVGHGSRASMDRGRRLRDRSSICPRKRRCYSVRVARR